MRLMVKLSSSPYQQQKSHAAAQCRVREDTDTDQREPSKFPVLLRGITHSNTPLSLLAVSFASDPYGGLVNPAAQSSKTVGLYAGSRGLRFSTALRKEGGGPIYNPGCQLTAPKDVNGLPPNPDPIPH